MKKPELEAELQRVRDANGSLHMRCRDYEKTIKELSEEKVILEHHKLYTEKRISFLEGELQGVRYPVGATLPEDKTELHCNPIF